MLKYLNYDIVMAEVPDEITLAINLTNCPYHCKGCHSPELREDIGEELTADRLHEMIDSNKGITCIAFMGGNSDYESLLRLFYSVKLRSDYPYKVAWYSGSKQLPKKGYEVIDYLKIGPYIESKGPLNNPSTNQRMYQIIHHDLSNNLVDITYKFQNK